MNPEELVKKAIADARENNPLIGMQLSGDTIYSSMQNLLTKNGRIHAETLLAALAALGGFSAVYDLVKKIESNEIKVELPEVAVLTLSDGRTAYAGDYINKQLAEGQISIWSLAAGMVQKLGCNEFCDLSEIFGRVASSIGGEEFGVVDVPEKHATDKPINFVIHFFPGFKELLQGIELPTEEYSGAFAFAVQKAMQDTSEVLPPSIALKIVMEFAIPMSKIDPHEVLK